VSNNILLADVAIAVALAILVLIISPGLAVVAIVAVAVLVICGVSFAVVGWRRRRARRHASTRRTLARR